MLKAQSRPPSRPGYTSLSQMAQVTSAPSPRRPRRWLAAPVAAALLGGGLMVGQGLAPAQVETMPLPEQAFAVDADQALELARAQVVDSRQQSAPDPESAVDGSGQQQHLDPVTAMQPSSVWVPSLGGEGGVHALVEASADFVDSSYDHVQTLRIPNDPKRAGWYSAGGALAGHQQGTTLIASHASTRSDPGVFRELHTVSVGDLVWTKDAAGTPQAWAVTELYHLEHAQFPQEYFAADGPRRLVLTTCGGRINEQGYYAENVFAVAVPIFAEGIAGGDVSADGPA